MSSIGTGYDLSASQFSPDGRVFQVEYAMKAVENSGTVIAFRGKDGVVIAIEKLEKQKLYEPSSSSRVFHIDEHIGMAGAGLLADLKQLVQIARDEACDYRKNYGSSIPLRYLADRVAMYMHAYTLYSAVRPFGCSVVIASYDETDGPGLYSIDPSGTCAGYYGVAVGKAKQAAKTEIERLNLSDMSMHDQIKAAAKIIHVVHDEVKDKTFQLEMTWVGKETYGKHRVVPVDLVSEADKYAKEAMEESDESDEDL